MCDEIGAPVHTVFLSPCGPTFDQAKARQLEASYDNLILICGHYEGVDQRFLDECVDEEISMGDFVLTGGEIPAMAIVLMPSHASSPACSATRSASPTRAIGTDCLNTRSIPGLTSGTAERAGGSAFRRPCEGRAVAEKAGNFADAAPQAGSVLQAALPV